MATKQNSKAKRSTTKPAPAVVTAIGRYSNLPDGHPALKQLARNVDAMLDAKREADERAKQKPKPKTLTLTEEQARDLGHQASDLALMLGAVRRLSWLIDSTDGDEAAAGGQALEAISELGAYKADAIVAALGGLGVGSYDEEFDRYARARGYVPKGADHG